MYASLMPCVSKRAFMITQVFLAIRDRCDCRRTGTPSQQPGPGGAQWLLAGTAVANLPFAATRSGCRKTGAREHSDHGWRPRTTRPKKAGGSGGRVGRQAGDTPSPECSCCGGASHLHCRCRCCCHGEPLNHTRAVHATSQAADDVPQQWPPPTHWVAPKHCHTCIAC